MKAHTTSSCYQHSFRTFRVPFFLAALALSINANAATLVDLGTASGFAVLAGSGITNTGTTTITGDIGTFPTLSITGAGSIVLNGVNHGGDAVTQVAKTDLAAAYVAALGQAPDTTYAGAQDLVGLTLASGVYRSDVSLELSGVLTLDALGNPNAVWVFQMASTLTTGTSSVVNLINGAQASNVFWQVGSSATLGTNSDFSGTILALTSITLTTGATVDGRMLASNGAVTLDGNTITNIPEPVGMLLIVPAMTALLLQRRRPACADHA